MVYSVVKDSQSSESISLGLRLSRRFVEGEVPEESLREWCLGLFPEIQLADRTSAYASSMTRRADPVFVPRVQDDVSKLAVTNQTGQQIISQLVHEGDSLILEFLQTLVDSRGPSQFNQSDFRLFGFPE